MSQSPTGASSVGSVDRYLSNWNALADLVAGGASFSGRERNCCFLNTARSRFADVSAATGLDLIDDGRGLATVDWDDDGDLDLWLSNRTGPRIRLMRNDVNAGNRFVALRLEGTTCNRDAIGARVELYFRGGNGRTSSHADREPTAASSKLVQTLRAGEGFLSQSSKWIHFGLGADRDIDRVVVHWPGTGELESFTGIRTNRRYRLVQGSGTAVAVAPRPATAALASSNAEAPPWTDQSRTILTRRRPLPQLDYRDFQGKDQSLDRVGTAGSFITLWASWCQPCLVELSELAQNATSFDNSGIEILALCTDTVGPSGRGDLSRAREFLRRGGLPFQTGVATERFVRELSSLLNDVFYRRRAMPLPVSFLVDRTGHVVAVYKGSVSTAQVLQDVTLLDAEPAEVDTAALPFAGSRVIRTLESSPIELAQAYRDGGYFEDARAEVTRFLDIVNSVDDADLLAVAMRRSLQPGVTLEQGSARPGGTPIASSEGAAGQTRDGTRPDPVDGSTTEALSAHRQPERALRAQRLGARIQAYQMLAKIEHDRQDFEGEITALRRLVALSPQSVTARTNLASRLWEAGQQDAAESLFAYALNLASDDPRKLGILGQAFMRLGQFDKAVDHFRQALRPAPEDVHVRLNLAMALHLGGHASDAIAEYRGILAKDPDSHEALNNLAWLYATQPQRELRNAAGAVELSRRLCEITQFEVPAYLDTLAAALAESGQFAEAVGVTVQAIPMARGRGEHALATKLQGRLTSYRSGKPVREQ